MLNNDWYSPATRWQGPASLPTNPDPNSGIAATQRTPGEPTVVYAVSAGALVYDYYDNGWQQAPLLYPR